jgi:hypothetical protein
MPRQILKMISRREFLVISGGALAAQSLLADAAADAEGKAVPALLDHILLGCNDLDGGIAFVEQQTGVRAAFGGVHPGRGTRNALLSLGERRYLEIIAPDPEQTDVPDSYGLRMLNEPRLVTWAAHPGDIKALAARLVKAGVAAEGPTPGSRKRPDGQVLQWQTLNLKDNADGLLPFFIEWSASSLHPSADSPKGCSVQSFEAVTPDVDGLRAMAKQLHLDVAIAKAEKAQLRAVIAGPRGELKLTS